MAQACLDALCARVGDSRVRKRDGQRTTVAALAAVEVQLLGPLPPAFPATLLVSRVVSAQALVAFRGNQYSVPPGLAGATVTVSHLLGEATLAPRCQLADHDRHSFPTADDEADRTAAAAMYFCPARASGTVGSMPAAAASPRV